MESGVGEGRRLCGRVGVRLLWEGMRWGLRRRKAGVGAGEELGKKLGRGGWMRKSRKGGLGQGICGMSWFWCRGKHRGWRKGGVEMEVGWEGIGVEKRGVGGPSGVGNICMSGGKEVK